MEANPATNTFHENGHNFLGILLCEEMNVLVLHHAAVFLCDSIVSFGAGEVVFIPIIFLNFHCGIFRGIGGTLYNCRNVAISEARAVELENFINDV